ncbi:MAG: flagellar basal body L-ring protein FlgH [Lacipirellulaceae bacterium]
MKTHFRILSCLALLLSLLSNSAVAQDASLLQRPVVGAEALTQQNSSFIYKELPPAARPRELQKNDIITVIVDYRTRMLSEGDAENRKTASLLAVLTDWIRFDGKSIQRAPQANGDPSIGGTLNSQYRAESDVELRDTLTFRIGAKIVDIRPNGNLVIEAHWNIRNNEEHWRISLSGVVRRESIQPDRTVTSDSIAELDVVKKEMGQVRDGYSRGWAQKWYDRFKPF